MHGSFNGVCLPFAGKLWRGLRRARRHPLPRMCLEMWFHVLRGRAKVLLRCRHYPKHMVRRNLLGLLLRCNVLLHDLVGDPIIESLQYLLRMLRQIRFPVLRMLLWHFGCCSRQLVQSSQSHSRMIGRNRGTGVGMVVHVYLKPWHFLQTIFSDWAVYELHVLRLGFSLV